ncbi:hypothetical protein EJ06DRAFT_534294 [Trichodelitschia bisporula]|uniref:Uncharacterized protein n=1 Tax=Trichodelitschia bisporula TaxID=703511 RepID=A0A6G1HJY9_9PEZI|nr:hypothetical protein EJ06DRAFT_534294 [Trichodelitschia bisporula]
MSGRPIARGPGRTVQPKGYARSTYDALFSQENRSVITAVGLFAVRAPPLRTFKAS